MSERPGFFRHMVDAASGGIAKVYTSAEILFAKLQEELKRLQDWVALGTVDLDSFVDERLEEVSDWELNFKYLKVQLSPSALSTRANSLEQCCRRREGVYPHFHTMRSPDRAASPLGPGLTPRGPDARMCARHALNSCCFISYNH
eukprot:scaffold216152_cov15-Prasinocladus_malaysianus.AAC.1